MSQESIRQDIIERTDGIYLADFARILDSVRVSITPTRC